ncbi:uncharacterized protein LOC128194394 [Vigna angularis]|uniref:uncharacterized protein LOC128194394 n=1 Tax=Phaseolus angularis TaxID=3914 RepID=UPI0022B40274|nr:uncharacterized protein LOC128194394 [Vigna angularis]
MDEGEIVVEYFDKVQELVNSMRAYNDGISNQYVVDKILRTLTPRFDHVVVTIEETRDLEKLEIEELQHSLEAHEKEWFVKMMEAMRGKIRFADDKSLTAEGSGRMVLRDGDGREVVIEEVLYVPGLKTNLLSLGQLL